jgi:hypothetical protein
MTITPKQKAKELVEYFLNHEPIKLSDYSRIYLPTAKQYAKKVCSEVLGDMGADRGYAFWTEVNNEIDNYNGE